MKLIDANDNITKFGVVVVVSVFVLSAPGFVVLGHLCVMLSDWLNKVLPY